MRRELARQVLYPETVADVDIVLPKKRRFKIRPEDQLQIACIKWLRAQEPDIRFVVCQPERLNPQVQRRDFLKALGILGNVGAPELMIFDARSILKPRTILCELKDAAKGRMSTGQSEWQTFCIGAGFEHAIVRSVEDLQRALG